MDVDLESLLVSVLHSHSQSKIVTNVEPDLYVGWCKERIVNDGFWRHYDSLFIVQS